MDALRRFFSYFFGAGETEEFADFSLAHFLHILLAAGVVCLIFRYRDRIRAWKHEKTLCLAIALVMIICEMSYFWRLVGVPSLHPNPVDHLPITVCGWGVIFGSYMMVTKSQSLFDIVYFWLFSGTIFALASPSVIYFTGPTRFRYYQFWIEHTIGYIAIFYMIFVHKLRPTVKSAIRSYAAFAVLAAVAFFANNLLLPLEDGTKPSYLFMTKAQDSSPILDILPSNFVLRVLLMAFVITVMYVLAYLPWLVKDMRAKREAQSEIAEVLEK